MNKHVLEPQDHLDEVGSYLDVADPGFYKTPLVKRALRSVRLAVSGYPANFVSREQWGAQPPKSKSNNITPASGGVAWHYEGPATGVYAHDTCAGRVRRIQAFHMGSQRGWADIAYSALVCPHGFIYEGRGINTRTAANGTNTGNQTHYAICAMVGQGDPLTAALIDAFKRGTQWLRTAGKAGKSIKPHRFFKPTGCPGDLIAAETAKYDGKDLAPAPAPQPPVTPTAQPAKGDTSAFRSQTYPTHPTHPQPLVTPTNGPEPGVVKDIQGHLNYAYYDHHVPMDLLKCDGGFGSVTQARLKDWQKRSGLLVDGKCGNDTWTRLHTVTERRRVDITGKAF